MAIDGILTLGPIAYHWDAATKRDFYARIADEAPVDTVYLGEVICSKRSPFFDDHLAAVAERLERAGKRVVLTSLAEVVLKRERKAALSFAADAGRREVEINNAAGLLHLGGRAHRIGPFLNVYNETTLAHLAARGATHVTLPPEMPGTAVAALARAAAEIGVGVEVQAFGRAGLAVSARCYHARAHGRTKDNCQFVCKNDPDGMPLATVAGQPFLRVNGIQTQSETYIALPDEMAAAAEAGVRAFRLMPQAVDMVAVAEVFAARLAGRVDGAEASARLGALNLPAPLSNGFWHRTAGSRRVPAHLH